MACRVRTGHGRADGCRHHPARPPAPSIPGRDRHEGVPAWHRTRATGGAVTTYPDHILRVGSQHLAELKRKAAEFERQLWDAHESLEQELDQAAPDTEVIVDGQQEAFDWATD